MVMGVNLTQGIFVASSDGLADIITAATNKVTPVANDEFFLVDSEAAGVGKSIKYSDLEAAIGGGGSAVAPERINISATESPYSLATLVGDVILAVDLNGGDVTVELPKVTELQEGYSAFVYVERNTGNSNVLTVNCNTTDRVRGNASVALNVVRDGIKLYPHIFITDHWDALNWERTDEIVYQAGNSGVNLIDSIQDQVSYSWSAGLVSSPPAFTDNADDTCDIGEFEVVLRSSNTIGDALKLYKIEAITSQSVPVESLYYLSADYNAGTPIAKVTTAAAAGINNDSVVLIGFLFNVAGVIHFMQTGDVPVDLPQKYHSLEQFRSGYVSKIFGGVVSSAATRYLQITSGYYKQGATFATTVALNTAVSGSFVRVYGDTSAGFTRVASQTQLNNTDYWNGTTDTLTALSAGRYAVRWIYQVIDAANYIVEFIHDMQYTTLGAARGATAPIQLPVELRSPIGPATLIARVIVQEGTTNAIETVNYSLSNLPTATATSEHNELAGLQGGSAGDYYHFTATQQTDVLAASSVELRHKRYEIIDPADDTGTLTLETGVTILENYEAFSVAYVYDSNADFIQAGNFVSVTDTNFSPYPVPASIQLVPATGAWAIFSPFPPFDAYTPDTPFAIVYGCKIALSDWDESAPLIS